MMAWYWIVLIAYFGINLILTGIAVIFAIAEKELLFWDDIWHIIQGLFLALPLVVISLINAWIDR